MHSGRVRKALIVGGFTIITLSVGISLFRPFADLPGGATLQAMAQTPPKSAASQAPGEPIGRKKNGILLVYPHNNSEINAPSTFLLGSVAPGTKLSVNGQTIKVNGTGLFAHVVPLSHGENHFKLVKDSDPSQDMDLTVKRPSPPQPIASDPLQILRTSLSPRQDLGLQPGDMVQFSMRGSPGGEASVTIAGQEVKLKSAGTPKNTGVNRGLDTTYGVTYQQSPPSQSDLYTGFYRVTASDKWQNEMPVFTLTLDGKTVSEPGSGHLTVIGQPFVACSLHDDTIVRVGPGAGRTTPMAQGVRVLVDGFVGDSYRCEMAPGKHLWIEKGELAESPDASGTPPTCAVRTINIENEGTNGARIVLPLEQRLPYEVKQEITPSNKLVLKVYGVTSDTDWITQPSTSSKAVSKSCTATKQQTAFPPAADREHNPISFISFQQMSDRLYQVVVNLNQHQQWGFWVDYEDTNLILHIKGRPQVNLAGGSLKGLKVCVDPGHGGRETGAIGCAGIKEATINLAIGKRVEHLLKERGADVIMTRTTDVDVSLADRVAIANRENADLLISIHGNSLPDGRNPLSEHGTSSYYYHPQSLALASHVRAGVVKDLGFSDFHTRFQNLALCRPSRMPAQLVEVGFVINPDECATMISAAGQEKAARGIVQGVHDFMCQATQASASPTSKAGKNASHRGH